MTWLRYAVISSYMVLCFHFQNEECRIWFSFSSARVCLSVCALHTFTYVSLACVCLACGWYLDIIISVTRRWQDNDIRAEWGYVLSVWASEERGDYVLLHDQWHLLCHTGAFPINSYARKTITMRHYILTFLKDCMHDNENVCLPVSNGQHNIQYELIC